MTGDEPPHSQRRRDKLIAEARAAEARDRKVADLEQRVAELGEQLKQLAARGAGRPQPPLAIRWNELSPDEYATKIGELREWMHEVLFSLFPADAAAVQGCWESHPFAREALGVAWQLHVVAWSSTADPAQRGQWLGQWRGHLREHLKTELAACKYGHVDRPLLQPFSWHEMSVSEHAEAMAALRRWIETDLRARFPADADLLVPRDGFTPCWEQHPAAVEAVTVAWQTHMAAWAPGAEPTARASWLGTWRTQLRDQLRTELAYCRRGHRNTQLLRRPIEWPALSTPERAEAMAALQDWMRTVLFPGFPTDAAVVKPCWAEHPVAVDALTLGWQTWTAAWSSPAEPTQRAQWMNMWRPAMREQLTRELQSCKQGHDRQYPPNPAVIDGHDPNVEEH